jgi:mono/diheme cytochrome c family protein
MRMKTTLLFVSLFGGSIAAVAATVPEVTFHKNVEAILQKHCQECHRPGEIAPFSMLTYEQTRPWAKAIKNDVLQGKMPPWPADPHYGKFANDRSLTKAEIETITAWVEANAPEGNKADAPKQRTWVEGWNISKPDAIVEMPQAFEMPASGEVEYQYVVVPTGFTEDKWISQVEVRPGDRTVVHHAVMFIREPGNPWLKEAKPGVPYVPKVNGPGQRFGNTNGLGNDILTIYTPGMVPDIWQPGQAKQIKAGSDLVLQMHYTASGKAATDRTRIGMVFAKQPPTQRIITIGALNNQFLIPAGDANYQAEGVFMAANQMTVISLFPHLHLRGKAFQYDVITPDGKSETLLKVKDWSLFWQLSYVLDKPLVLEPGTKIKATAWWDNSANNKDNPDPTKDVKWGEQSWEEMLIGFVDVAVDPNITNRNIYSKQKVTSPQ